jgi:DNA-binding winged helix-turn-helix (wHTH) protein
VILVENAGRLVTKETLLNHVWQDSFVEEGNLNSSISRLRKILGEKPNENLFIETVPKSATVLLRMSSLSTLRRGRCRR